MFWILSAALLMLAAWFIILPLLRSQKTAGMSGEQERNAANLAIYQERLQEIQGDLDAGLIDAQQFEMLKLELERNLLADVNDEQSKAHSAARGKKESWLSAGRAIPLLMLLTVPVLSYVFYEQWGFRSELSLRELHEKTLAAEGNPEQALAVIYELTDFIDANSDSGWAWYFLAQNLSVLGQMAEVSIALERASTMIDQPQDKAFLLGRYALNEYLLPGQEMNAKIREITAQALRLDPNQLFVLQILALDAERSGATQEAITYWQRVLQMAPSEEEALFLRSHIAGLQASTNSSTTDVDTAAGPQIDVEITLAPGISLPPETRVFVSALEVDGRGQPLAAKVISVADLPATISLDNAAAVGPFNLSSAALVYVVVTASITGTANVQAGDYQVRSEPFAHNESHAIIQLQISEQITE